jgi:hypothetical protein
VPCSVKNMFDFGFGGPDGPVIKVPIYQMIGYQILSADKQRFTDRRTELQCELGVLPAVPVMLLS